MPRETPYLGALRAGEERQRQGLFRAQGQPHGLSDHRPQRRRADRDARAAPSAGARPTASSRRGATMAIIDDLLADFVVGRDPLRRGGRSTRISTTSCACAAIPAASTSTRSRRSTSRFGTSAGKLAGLPLVKLLGGQRHAQLPAYVSGLPKPTLAERAGLRAARGRQGLRQLQVRRARSRTTASSPRLADLRERARADKARIACDMHWAYTADEAIALDPRAWSRTASGSPRRRCARRTSTASPASRRASRRRSPRARNGAPCIDLVPRIAKRACSIVQPEMGHTGVTEFMRIGHYAQAHHLRVIPHATIGIGPLPGREPAGQRRPFGRDRVTNTSTRSSSRTGASSSATWIAARAPMPCRPVAGLGVEPSEEALRLLQRYNRRNTPEHGGETCIGKNPSTPRPCRHRRALLLARACRAGARPDRRC